MRPTSIKTKRQQCCGAMMRPLTACLATVALTAVLSGCVAANSLLGGNTRKEALAEITWDFADNAILIELQADVRLNDYAGEAHTLVLGIYQMEDSAAFYKLAADTTMLSQALESGKSGQGFLQFVRYVVTPGQRSVLTASRVQKAKFIGVVAGYYQMSAVKSTRLFEVPLTIASDGLLSKTYKAAPATLVVRLNLGSESVISAQRLNHDLTEKKTFASVPLDGGGKELKLTPADVQRVLDVDSVVKKLDK